MSITFNDLELLLIFSTLFVCASLFCTILLYKCIMYSKRRLNYQFYEARDALIRCVALNLIGKDNELFKTFYSASNNLISVTNTDLFSLRRFLTVVMALDNQEDKVFGSKLISEMQKQPQQFLDAVDKLFSAIENTFIKKNFLLRVFVGSFTAAFIIKKIIARLLNINPNMNIPITEQKIILAEYRKIENLRQSLIPAAA